MNGQSLVDYLNEEQRALANQLAAEVDPCLFRKVKQYLHNPNSEISTVVLVEPTYRIEEVGAVMVSGGVPQFSVCLALGAARFGVERAAADAQHVFVLSNISDSAYCRVLYLPPAYVVQLDPDSTVKAV